MSLLTTRLGIKKPQDSDPFLTADFDTNYDLLDSYPGVWVCTSTTLPSWGSPQAGQLAMCTNTRTLLEWTGSAWRDLLVAPAMWALSTFLGTSLSPGITAATFSVGTVSSSRACAAVANLQLTFGPLPPSLPYTVSITLVVNGVDGPTFWLADYAGIPNNDVGTHGTALTGGAATGAVSLNAGSNTISLKATYDAPSTFILYNDMSSGLPLPSASPSLYIASVGATLLAASSGPN